MEKLKWYVVQTSINCLGEATVSFLSYVDSQQIGVHWGSFKNPHMCLFDSEEEALKNATSSSKCSVHATFIMSEEPAVPDQEQAPEVDPLAGYRKVDPSGQHFAGKRALLRTKVLKPQFHDVKSRLVECTGGFGCDPAASGNAVYVRFVADGEKARYNRGDIECLLEPDGPDEPDYEEGNVLEFYARAHGVLTPEESL